MLCVTQPASSASRATASHQFLSVQVELASLPSDPLGGLLGPTLVTGKWGA